MQLLIFVFLAHQFIGCAKPELPLVIRVLFGYDKDMLAHIDLDAFFASVEQRDHPKWRGKPLVVGFVTPQGNICNRGVVSAASYEARKYGIFSGMSLWEAKRRCKQLILVGGNFGKYQEASQKMYQILTGYSPNVELLSLDEAFISFEGCEAIYNNLVEVCQKIKDQVKSEIGITVSCGLASNKLVAKMASDFQKPDGLTVVPAGGEKAFLVPLPVIKLYGVGPAIFGKLAQLGIKTVGQLAGQDKNLLISLFGRYGQTLWLAANGIGQTAIDPLAKDAKSIGRSITFPQDSANISYLHQNLVYLACKVAAALQEEKLEGHSLTLTLRDHNFKTWSHQKVTVSPITTADQILKLSQNLLNTAWDRTILLRLLGISISHLWSNTGQLSLWENFEKRRILEETSSKIRDKFGFWSIRPASISQ